MLFQALRKRGNMEGRRLKKLINMMIAEDRHELGVLRKRLERLPKEKIIIRHRSNCQECYIISKEACTGKRVETYVPKKNLRKLVE